MHSTGHHHPAHHGPSLLEQVANHETALLEELAASEQEARGVLDEAHSEATAFLSSDYAQLEKEVADLRRVASEKRDAETLRIQQESERKVAAIRESASGKLDAVFREVVGRVVPRA